MSAPADNTNTNISITHDGMFIEAAERPKEVSISSCGTDPLAYRHVAGTGSSRASSVSGHSSFFDGSNRGSSTASSNDGDHHGNNGGCDEPDPHHTNAQPLSALPGIRQGSAGGAASAGGTTTRTGKNRRQRIDVDTADVEEFVRRRAGQGKAIVTNSNGDIIGYSAGHKTTVDGEAADPSTIAEPLRVTSAAAAAPIVANHNTAIVPAPIAAIPTSIPIANLSTEPFATIESVIPRSSTVVAAHTRQGSVVDCGAIVALADGTVVGTIATLLGAVLSCRYAIVGDSGAFADLLMKGKAAEDEHNATITAVSIQQKQQERINKSVVGKDSDDEADEEEDTHKGFLAYTPLAIGTKLYYDTTDATIIYDPAAVAANQKEATDASFVNDDELPDNKRPDFSDDEKEREWKRERKGGNKNAAGGAEEGSASAAPANNNDDDDDVMPLGHDATISSNNKKKNSPSKKKADGDATAAKDSDDEISSSGSEAEFDEEGAMVAYKPSKRARGLGNVLGIGIPEITAARTKQQQQQQRQSATTTTTTSAASPITSPTSSTNPVVTRGRGNMQIGAVGSQIVDNARPMHYGIPHMAPPMKIVVGVGANASTIIISPGSDASITEAMGHMMSPSADGGIVVDTTAAAIGDRQADDTLDAKRRRGEGGAVILAANDAATEVATTATTTTSAEDSTAPLATLLTSVTSDEANATTATTTIPGVSVVVGNTANTTANPHSNSSSITSLPSIRIGTQMMPAVELNGGQCNIANSEFRSSSFMASHSHLPGLDDGPIVLGSGGRFNNQNNNNGGMRNGSNSGYNSMNTSASNLGGYGNAMMNNSNGGGVSQRMLNQQQQRNNNNANNNATPTVTVGMRNLGSPLTAGGANNNNNPLSNMTSPNASLSSLPHLTVTVGHANNANNGGMHNANSNNGASAATGGVVTGHLPQLNDAAAVAAAQQQQQLMAALYGTIQASAGHAGAMGLMGMMGGGAAPTATAAVGGVAYTTDPTTGMLTMAPAAAAHTTANPAAAAMGGLDPSVVTMLLTNPQLLQSLLQQQQLAMMGAPTMAMGMGMGMPAAATSTASASPNPQHQHANGSPSNPMNAATTSSGVASPTGAPTTMAELMNANALAAMQQQQLLLAQQQQQQAMLQLQAAAAAGGAVPTMMGLQQPMQLMGGMQLGGMGMPMGMMPMGAGGMVMPTAGVPTMMAMHQQQPQQQ